MKRLRKTTNAEIGMFATGEYGDQNKRPHWHAIIFNWSPLDRIYKYSNDRGDKVYSSETLSKLWQHGIAELGSVTFESAGYCARYAAKKLIHGKDEDHDFAPISKKSSKNAIGKKFLERHWQDIFNSGFCLIKKSNGNIVKSSIPRYYEKWLKKNQPQAWIDYVTQLKQQTLKKITAKAEEENAKERKINNERLAKRKPLQVTKNQAKAKILKQKFKQLQSYIKL